MINLKKKMLIQKSFWQKTSVKWGVIIIQTENQTNECNTKSCCNIPAISQVMSFRLTTEHIFQFQTAIFALFETASVFFAHGR